MAQDPGQEEAHRQVCQVSRLALKPSPWHCMPGERRQLPAQFASSWKPFLRCWLPAGLVWGARALAWG